MIKTLIADDHPVFRRGLVDIIKSDSGLEVVAEAPNGAEALRLVRLAKPDVAVLDLDMPELNGLDTARAMRNEKSTAGIVILTMYKDERLFNEALDAGVKGYVLKESAVADILGSVRAVAAGRHYISPAISDFLVRRNSGASPLSAQYPGLSALTPAERRILRLVASDKTSKEIASDLGLSARTVENHRASVCSKLNLHGAHSLIKFAFENRDRL